MPPFGAILIVRLDHLSTCRMSAAVAAEASRELLEAIECPVCLTVPSSSVYVGQCGHHICGTCLERNQALETCPLCRENWPAGTFRRLWMLESLNRFDRPHPPTVGTIDPPAERFSVRPVEAMRIHGSSQPPPMTKERITESERRHRYPTDASDVCIALLFVCLLILIIWGLTSFAPKQTEPVLGILTVTWDFSKAMLTFLWTMLKEITLAVGGALLEAIPTLSWTILKGNDSRSFLDLLESISEGLTARLREE